MSDETYLIWSNEHGLWWRAGGYGYTPRLSEAGRYSHHQATDICTRAIPGTADRLHVLPELPVRLADVVMMREKFRAEYPDLPTEAWEQATKKSRHPEGSGSLASGYSGVGDLTAFGKIRNRSVDRTAGRARR